MPLPTFFDICESEQRFPAMVERVLRRMFEAIGLRFFDAHSAFTGSVRVAPARQCPNLETEKPGSGTCQKHMRAFSWIHGFQIQNRTPPTTTEACMRSVIARGLPGARHAFMFECMVICHARFPKLAHSCPGMKGRMDCCMRSHQTTEDVSSNGREKAREMAQRGTKASRRRKNQMGKPGKTL